MEKPFGRSHKRVAMTALFFSQNTIFCRKRSVDPEQIPKWRSYFSHKKPFKFEVLFKHDGIEDTFVDFESLLNNYSDNLKIKPIGRRYTSTYETTSFQNNSAISSAIETVTSNISLSIDFEISPIGEILKSKYLKNSFVFSLMQSTKNKLVKPRSKWIFSNFNFLV
jgi:hypothetical protein